MAKIPGLPASIFFGDTVAPLPDWRAHREDAGEGNDSDELTPDERAVLVAVLGFDPAEMGEDENEDEDEEPGEGAELSTKSGDADGHALAEFYAGMLNALAAAKRKLPEGELATISAELGGTGWLVDVDDVTGNWVARRSSAELSTEG